MPSPPPPSFQSSAVPEDESPPSPSASLAASAALAALASRKAADAALDAMDFRTPTVELSSQKKKDYGFGHPHWSPYRTTAVTSTPEWKGRIWSTCNQEWGSYTKQTNALDPQVQSRLARGMVKEMKNNACIDHTWEIVGQRPGVDKSKPTFFMP